MITPGDIPESMVKKAAIMEQSSWDGGRWDNLIAMVLNEAIEAGLVSPPCWEVIPPSGARSNIIYKTKACADSVAFCGEGRTPWSVEHWKGQAQ